LLAAAAAAAFRGAQAGSRPGLAELGMLAVVAGSWTGQGLVVASPYDVVVWLAVGLVALGCAEARRARA
jgi:hypothetical protein